VLIAGDWFEAERDHQIASVGARRLRIEIRARKTWRGKMLRYIPESRHRPALTSDRPDVNGGYLIRAASEQSDIGVSQIHFVKNEGIMTPAVEVKERHGPKQFFLSAERQNAFRIEGEVPHKIWFRNTNSGDQSISHIGKGGKLGRLRRLHVDFRASRQQVEIVPCGKSAPFNHRVMHLSSPLSVGLHHTERGFEVCSNYCTGVLR